MAWPILLVLQIAANAAGDAISFDLRDVKPTDDCAAGSANEIVVCAQRGGADPNRLIPLPRSHYDDPLTAEIGIIGNVRGSATIESLSLGQGVVSNRAMVNIKIPF